MNLVLWIIFVFFVSFIFSFTIFLCFFLIALNCVIKKIRRNRVEGAIRESDSITSSCFPMNLFAERKTRKKSSKTEREVFQAKVRQLIAPLDESDDEASIRSVHLWS